MDLGGNGVNGFKINEIGKMDDIFVFFEIKVLVFRGCLSDGSCKEFGVKVYGSFVGIFR